MKEVKYLIILTLLVICLIPFNVMAAGSVTVSKSSITLTKGTSTTFVIKANNSAGRINISTSNSNVASVSSSSVFLDMQSSTITVKGVSAGTATITVSLADVTTYNDEDLSGKKYTISVKVNNPVINNNNNNNNNGNNNLSKNNKIKTLSIEGYDLTKVDDNNYTLTVNNGVESIKINAIAEDSKSKITGAGVHEIKVGQNKIELIVISESGAKNKITIKITKKDGYYIEDLDDVLKDKTLEDININSDSKILSDTLIKLKSSGKKIKFNYHDKDKKLIYSWSVDGTKLNNTNEFLTTIEFDAENSKKIDTISNYASGLYLHFDHSGTLPEGTKIKVYVGDKFESDSLVNLYYYNKDKKQLESVKKGLKVESEYVEFEIDECSEYFMTMSDIKAPLVESDIIESQPINIFKIVSIIELVLIFIIIVMDYLQINPVLKLKKSNINNYIIVNK